MEEKKGLIAEFKEFISRGSVIDLAVGVVIGGAFTAIITSLVNDILMPIIGALFGGVNFTGLKIVIKEAVGETPEAAITYGNFIQAVVNFLLVAFMIFLVVKAVNKMRRKKDEEPAPEPEPEPDPEDIVLLREIRDLLKK